jgi:hypothetical protein
MNYLRLAILLAAFAQYSYADSIPTFHITEATMFMGPNDGSGDNVFYSFTGPGVTITGLGGMACFDWCFGPVSDPNGSESQVFAGFFDTVIIGGRSYDPFALSIDIFDCCGGLNASARGIVGSDTGPLEFRLTLPTGGSWSFHFAPTTDQDGNPAFIFTDGSFQASAPLPTPEPATIGLMLTGLAGIAGIVKRKSKFHR